ncbi:unnamed protein product [Prunus armeniaca]
MSARRIEHWASISAWIVAYDSGWIGCNYAEFKRQHLQLIKFSWKLIPMSGLAELLIYSSHGEACKMDVIEISSVWMGLSERRLDPTLGGDTGVVPAEGTPMPKSGTKSDFIDSGSTNQVRKSYHLAGLRGSIYREHFVFGGRHVILTGSGKNSEAVCQNRIDVMVGRSVDNIEGWRR